MADIIKLKDHQATKSQNPKVIKVEGVGTLYTRGRSPYYYGSIPIPGGKPDRFSTKETDADLAEIKLRKRANKLEFHAEHNIPIKATLLSDLIPQWKVNFEKLVEEGEAKLRQKKDYFYACDTYIDPYLGHYEASCITSAILKATQTDWKRHHLDGLGSEEKTLTYVRNGRTITRKKSKNLKKVSKGSFGTARTTFNMIIQFAIDEGLISEFHAPRFTKQKGGRKAIKELDEGRRPFFRPHEIAILRNGAIRQKWINAGRDKREREYRAVMWDKVDILYGSGMRNGTEAKHVRWCDWLIPDEYWWSGEQVAISKDLLNYAVENHQFIGFTKKPDDYDSRPNKPKWKVYVRHSKTVAGTAICKTSVRLPLARLFKRRWDYLQEVGEEFDPTESIFVLPDGRPIGDLYSTWRKLMDFTGLSLGPTTGVPRTQYSIRHSYASRELLDLGKSKNAELVAANMRTSVEMLHKHYVHAFVDDHADELERWPLQ